MEAFLCKTGKENFSCPGISHKNFEYFSLFLFSNKMLVFRAGIYKMVVRIASNEDPDQTASLEAV